MRKYIWIWLINIKNNKNKKEYTEKIENARAILGEITFVELQDLVLKATDLLKKSEYSTIELKNRCLNFEKNKIMHKIRLKFGIINNPFWKKFSIEIQCNLQIIAQKYYFKEKYLKTELLESSECELRSFLEAKLEIPRY